MIEIDAIRFSESDQYGCLYLSELLYKNEILFAPKLYWNCPRFWVDCWL